MRKTILKIIFTGMLFIGINNVKAEFNYKTIIDDAANGKAILLCDYKSLDTNDGVRIYVYPVNSSFEPWRSGNKWAIVYKTSSSNYKLLEGLTAWQAAGTYTNTFINDRVYYGYYESRRGTIKNKFYSKEEKFICPKYAAINTRGLNEICFSESADKCSSIKFNRGILTLESEELFEKARSTAINAINSISEYDIIKGEDIESYVENSVKNNIESVYTEGNETLNFMDTYSKNIIDLQEVNTELQNKIDSIKDELEKKCENKEYTEEQCHKALEYADRIKENHSLQETEEAIPANRTECTYLFDADIRRLLNNILKTIQYAGPLLVAILTIVDLVKATLSGDQGELKKVYQKFLKRLIAAILLFFVPVIVNLIITLVDNASIPEACL